MSTPKNFKGNLEDEQEQLENDDYLKIATLRKQGNRTGTLL